MKFIINFASRSRPDKFFRCLDNLKEMWSESGNQYEVIANLDADDKTMHNADVMKRMNQYENLRYYFGRSKNKVDAINRGIIHFPENWDILINLSDDMVFVQESFDLIIDGKFNLFGNKTFLHFRDSNHNPPDALCTMSIIGKEYFDIDKYIYHPAFQSVWCDNLAQDMAKQRGCYHYCPEIIFEHLHPAYGKGQNDSQYKRTESKLIHMKDHQTYLRLKRELLK